MNAKQFYSPNMIAWISSRTGLIPTYKKVFRPNGAIVAASFPDVEAVSIAVNEYQNNQDLQPFIAHYKVVRSSIKEALHGEDK